MRIDVNLSTKRLIVRKDDSEQSEDFNEVLLEEHPNEEKCPISFSFPGKTIWHIFS
jgi:hypothetical protein